MDLHDVSSSYDRVAKHYDALTGLFFHKLLRLEQYRRRTIELLGDVRGATVLDVGCGTGSNFPLLVPGVGPAGRVIGIDYSEGMLRQARERVRRHGWRNVDLVRGDAVTLAELDGPVDCLVSVWCYGNVYDVAAALDRAVDIVRPGGAIAIMAFARSHPDKGPLRWLFPVYRRLFARAGGVDTARYMDDVRVRAKWSRAREVLRSRLGDFHEERHLHGMGAIIASRKTAPVAAALKRAV